MTEKLHDDILRELPDDFIRRMRNWARERDGGRIANAYLGERVDGWMPEVPIPTLVGEADDTHRALRRLPQRHQEVITCFWCYHAQPLRWMATATPRLRLWRLGPASFRQWLDIGHARLRAVIEEMSIERNDRSAKTAAAQTKR